MAKKWIIKQRNDVSKTLTFKNEDGTAVDLTGATIFFTVKSTLDGDNSDLSAAIKKNITVHTDPVNGLSTLTLSETDTDIAAGTYKYDFKLKTASGSETNYNTQELVVQEVVTRRSA